MPEQHPNALRCADCTRAGLTPDLCEHTDDAIRELALDTWTAWKLRGSHYAADYLDAVHAQLWPGDQPTYRFDDAR